MALTPKEICDNVTLAREMSMLGNYESAEIYYEGTIQMLNRFIITISEPLRKNKWQEVWYGSILIKHYPNPTYAGTTESGR